jgi:hypothetical protein
MSRAPESYIGRIQRPCSFTLDQVGWDKPH